MKIVNNKERAIKMRESAKQIFDMMNSVADSMEQKQEQAPWERIRDCYDEASCVQGLSSESVWKAVLAEANKGKVDKDELKRRAPWFSGGSGPGFSPIDYNSGVLSFLNILDSL